MYNEGTGGAALGTGGVLGAGALATTGFNVLAFAVAAFTLIFIGLLLLRMATVKTSVQD